MKTLNTLSGARLLMIIALLSFSVVTYSQPWVKYGSDSISYEKSLKIPGQNIGNRHVLTIDEFNKFSKIESIDVNTDLIVKSYSLMAFGKDKGFVMAKRKGNEVDNMVKRLMKDEPYLGYRIIFYDIIYDKINKQKPGESQKDLNTAFILEIK